MSPLSSIHVSLPYIKQGTDQVSSVAGYKNSLLVCDGIDDIDEAMTRHQNPATTYNLTR